MIDARERVSGRIERVADVTLPDMAEAVLVRSPIACGNIERLDVSAARGARGVLAIVTAVEVAEAGLGGTRFGTIMADQPILAIDRVATVYRLRGLFS